MAEHGLGDGSSHHGMEEQVVIGTMEPKPAKTIIISQNKYPAINYWRAGLRVSSPGPGGDLGWHDDYDVMVRSGPTHPP